ncbi:hypothetical protein ACEQ8H_000083 [Pleosporales sp. CAS-2024a]
MPPWGRPLGAQDVGRHFQGTEDGVYRFQELDSDDERNGVSLDDGLQNTFNSKKLHSPDDLDCNDMDIGAWERRASALEGSPDDLGHDRQDEDQGYYDEAGEAVTRAEYEELLFTRVLDKIRIARAAGNPDVQLNTEELEAYQTRLYGARSPTAASHPKSHSTDSPTLDDSASVMSANTNRPGYSSSSKSKSKKAEPRTSLFSSKSKKEKRPERKRAASNVSSGSSQTAPGFMIPGPDGQRIYTPINAYQGNSAGDGGPRPVSGSSQTYGGYAHSIAPSEVAKEVPGSFHGYRPTPAPFHRSASPPHKTRPHSSQQPTQEASGSRLRSPSIQSANFVPFPVEPYQYQTFSTSSSPSEAAPPLQYMRRPSAPPSEASYTSMPRRVPVPSYVATASAAFDMSPTQTCHPSPGIHGATEHQGAVFISEDPEPVTIQPAKASGSGRDGERRRKSGKSKKRT